MRLTRVLAISLLFAMGIARGVAQTPRNFAPMPNSFAAQPLPGSRIPPMDFDVQAPNAKSSVHALNSRTIRQLNPFVYRPNDLYALDAPNASVRLVPGTQMAHNDSRCYSMREYQFSRVAPDSDTTKLSGASTCEPASQVRLKGAR